jgi:hypothetical protein
MSNAIQITIKYGTDPSYNHTGNFVSFAVIMTIQAISGLVYSILLILIQSSSFANFVNQRFRQKSVSLNMKILLFFYTKIFCDSHIDSGKKVLKRKDRHYKI